MKNLWQICFWILLSLWMLGAGLFMARIRGGFFTNYLSDLAFPPWFYINIRGLAFPNRPVPRLLIVGDWFGRTGERALAGILVVGVVSEFVTYFWPHGLTNGTFDPIDILCYASGLGIAYFFDNRSRGVSQKKSSR